MLLLLPNRITLFRFDTTLTKHLNINDSDDVYFFKAGLLNNMLICLIDGRGWQKIVFAIKKMCLDGISFINDAKSWLETKTMWNC